jgi:DNA-3-methyladenine glycosylase II
MSRSTLLSPRVPREPARLSHLGLRPFVMTDHPAWWPCAEGWWRAFRAHHASALATVSLQGELAVQPLGGAGADWRPDRFELPAPTSAADGMLLAGMEPIAPVLRFRNPDLWDALATAIVRQVIRAGQSKRLYRAFAAAFGDCVSVGSCGERYCFFPTAEQVLALDDHHFSTTGMAFKRLPLRSAAAAYLQHSRQWASLPAAELVEALQAVPGVGPWTARAAVADHSNDWSLYPYGDLAVRTWARHAAPLIAWPNEEDAFAQMWRSVTGSRLGGFTLLVLAYGSRHGDIG